MSGDSVQSLQGDIVRIYTVQHSDGMDIVGKMASRGTEEKLVQILFPRVTEGSVSDVVTEGDGFNKILIEIQGGAYGAGNAGHKLDMQCAAGNIVVFIKRKNLCLVRKAGIICGVQYLIRVAHKGRAPHGGLVVILSLIHI